MYEEDPGDEVVVKMRKSPRFMDILVHAQKRICLGADQFIAGVQIFHGLHEMKYFSLEVFFLAKIYV